MSTPSQPPRRHSKWRLAAFSACRRLTQGLGGRAFYRWNSLRPGKLVLREEVLCVPRPGIVVVTGDFITDTHTDALPVIPDLGLFKARYGGWAVFGNHDYRNHKHDVLEEHLARVGIRCLQDAGERVGDLPLWISGLNDLEESANPDPTRAREHMDPGDVEIMLCHNPLGARQLARPGCIAVLSGHSHGGQIDLPWLRTLGPTHPGLSMSLGPTTLIVSRGLGVVGVPLRMAAPAEMVWIELRRGHAQEGRRTRMLAL